MAAAYGMAGAEPVSEDAPLRPVNPYGDTKLMCERIIGDAAQAHALVALCLRYFNVGAVSPVLRDMGPGRLVAVAAWEDRPVTVNGKDHKTVDIRRVRDYIRVEGLAEGYALIADALAAGVYDRGSALSITSPPVRGLRCLRF